AFATVGPLKAINVYGWSLCGSLPTILQALYNEYGWKTRYRGWHGHMTMEVHYDGRWHYLDVFMGCYFRTRDKNTIAGQDDIIADPDIVRKAVAEGRVPTPYMPCGDSPEGVITGVKGSVPWDPAAGHDPAAVTVIDVGGTARAEGVDHPSAARLRLKEDPAYSTAVRLQSGMRLTLAWAAAENGQFGINGKQTAPGHTCGIKDFRTDPKLGPILMPYGRRSWANGEVVYAPDFANPAAWEDLAVRQNVAVRDGVVVPVKPGRPAYVGLRIQGPYVCSLAKAAAEWSSDDPGNGLEVSLDGQSWRKVPPPEPTAPAAAAPTTASMAAAWLRPGEQDLTMGRYDKDGVLGRYGFYVRASVVTGLKKLTVTEMVEHNRCAQPYLVNGPNEITVTLDDAAALRKNRLFVTYAYAEGRGKPARPRYPFDGTAYEWGPEKTVRKEVTATPFRFTIDVGGDTPPNMVSLTRELLPR
ncbi:MAG TPA: hypothetical protein VM389_11250, partial [Phycisphaerae bacterium]|nr:hypothetical protein [Phycisphaerae bacterium]